MFFCGNPHNDVVIFCQEIKKQVKYMNLSRFTQNITQKYGCFCHEPIIFSYIYHKLNTEVIHKKHHDCFVHTHGDTHTQNILSFPSPLEKVLDKNIYPSFTLFLTWPFFSFSFFICLNRVCFCLLACLSVSVGVYTTTSGLWKRSLPFSSNWPAPFSPCLQDNWTCNPNPRIPIIGCLQTPLHSTHFSSQCETLYGPVFDHCIKGNIQSCTVQTYSTAQASLHLLTIPNISV